MKWRSLAGSMAVVLLAGLFWAARSPERGDGDRAFGGDRDLTLAMGAGADAPAASPLELNRPPRATHSIEAPIQSAASPSLRSDLAPAPLPVPVTLPEAERLLGPPPPVLLAVQPEAHPLGASVLHSGRTAGAPTPQPIRFTRPRSASLPLPEDYYRWPAESAAAPRRGVIIAIGGGGGTCDGPGRGAFVRPTLQRF